MGQELTYDVFLRHSAKDKAVVRALAERLREHATAGWLEDCIDQALPR